MQPLRCILVACILLQFARADGNKNDELIADADGDDPSEVSPWADDLKAEDITTDPIRQEDEEEHAPVYEEEEDTSDGVKHSEEEIVEATEDSERLQEEETGYAANWDPPLERQREQVLEELEDEALSPPTREDEEYEEMLKEGASIIVEAKDRAGLRAYVEKQRRLALEEALRSDFPYAEPRGSSDQASGEGDFSSSKQGGKEETAAYDEADEEEAAPLIPGLTDVDLVAFNAEFANEDVLDKIIDWSYDQVAAQSAHRDTYIHAEDLYAFLLKTLNPLDEEIDAEDEEILRNAVAELRQQQGLVDDGMILYRGFIARGMPLRFLQNLAHEMHRTVQTRRLRATAGEL